MALADTLSMRIPLNCRLLVAATALAVGVTTASVTHAQPGGMGGGGMGGGGMPSPAPLFKDKKKNKEEIGLSLAATDEPVIDVRIVGNKLIPTSQILNEMQTRVGRPYDPTLVQRDVRKLATRSWFVSVEPQIEQTPTGRIVTIKVAERPTIRYIQYLGNKSLRDSKLAKETGLKVGGSVDPYAVEEARRKLIALYKENGFSNTQVTVLEGNKPTDQGIVYVIDEGTAQKIWSVKFVGEEFVSGRRLKTQIDSKPPMMFVFKGYVDRDQIDADVNKLTAYYRSFGFFQAKVGRTIEFNEKGNWATLTFVINEGPRYQVRNVSYIGSKIFAETSLGMDAKLPAGTPFEQAKMNNDVAWLKELYGSQGYVFADIQAEPIFLEEPGKIDLVYHIDEGRQWKVGRIFVHIDGENPHTRIQTALNRLSITPGEIVDIREIHASERRLQASSLFLTDPVKGVRPKITYRIPESGEMEASRPKDGNEFRGQSPDVVARAPKLVPVPAQPGDRGTTYELPPPPGYKPSDEAMEVHLYFDGPPSNAVPAPAAQPQPQPNESGNSPYQTLVVRGQSPQQQPTSQPYAATAAAATSNSPYGGLAVGATGPDASPVGHNAQPVAAVQPVQYTEPIPPPAGAPFGPPPIPQTVAPDQAITPVPGGPGMPPGPGMMAVPANPQLFPSGGTEPWARPYDAPPVDIFVDTAESQTGRLMLGVAVNSDAGLMGQILLDEQNFDWTRWPTSMDDVVSGKAFRGAGERFRLEAMPGTEVQRYVASFQEPYLWDTPVSLGLSGSYYDRRFLDWTEQRLGGRVSLGYQWTADDVSAALAYRGESVKIFDLATPANPSAVPEFESMAGDNVLHGFKFTLANDTRDSAFFATSGHYVEGSIEEVVGTFTYPRANLDLRQYQLVTERPDHSGRHVVAYSTNIGVTGDNTPPYERFFAGGSTFRGFDFHTVTPIKGGNGANQQGGVEVGGRFMWINSLEYLFPLTADDMLHGVVFTDFGTVQENVKLDDFRVSPGFGLRITIPAMGPAPIALDFAFPVLDAPTDKRQVFSFTIGFNR